MTGVPSQPPAIERPDFGEGYNPPEGTPFDPAPWSAVRDKLAASRNYWVSTTRADGSPHAAPIWGVWHQRRFDLRYVEEVGEGGEPAARSPHRRPSRIRRRRGDRDRHGDSPSADAVSEVTLLDAYEAKYAFRPDPGGSADDQWFRLSHRRWCAGTRPSSSRHKFATASADYPAAPTATASMAAHVAAMSTSETPMSRGHRPTAGRRPARRARSEAR